MQTTKMFFILFAMLIQIAFGQIAFAQTSNEEQTQAEQTEDKTTETAEISETRVSSNNGVVTLKATVTGNQEQPKILYIVPWKAVKEEAILYQGLDPKTMDNVFGHIERSEHRREVRFLETLSID